jgi:hypothetical protein
MFLIATGPTHGNQPALGCFRPEHARAGKRRAGPARAPAQGRLGLARSDATVATPRRRPWPWQRDGYQWPTAVSGRERKRRDAHENREEKANTVMNFGRREEGESAGGRSASSAALSTAARAGTTRLSPTYASKESLTPVQRRGEGGGALCAR